MSSYRSDKFINEVQAEGKTIAFIKHYSYGEDLCISFTDGTYFLIETHRGYDDEIQLDIGVDMMDYDAKNLGIISEEEYNQIKKAEEERKQAEKKKSELNTYLRLKKKFEGK